MLPKPYPSSSSSAGPATPPRYGPRPLATQHSPARIGSVNELAVKVAQTSLSASPPSPDKPLPQLPDSVARHAKPRTESVPSSAYAQAPLGPWQLAAAAAAALSTSPVKRPAVERPALPQPPRPQSHSSPYVHVPEHVKYYPLHSMPVAGPSRIRPDQLVMPIATSPSRIAMPTAMPYQSHAHASRPASAPRQVTRAYNPTVYPYPWELARPSDSPGGIRPNSAPNSIVTVSSITQQPATWLVAPPAPLRPGSAPTEASRPPTSSVASSHKSPFPLQPGQCAGIKKDGNRCTRRVRSEASKSRSSTRRRGTTPSESLSKGRRAGSTSPSKKPGAATGSGRKADKPIVISDSEDSDVEELSSRSVSPTKATYHNNEEDAEEASEYCHQHLAEINRSTALALPTGAVLAFPSILASLTPRGAARIRASLNKGLSVADRAQRGYIYVYALRDRDTLDSVCLKVGRATRVFERIGQWRKQCGSNDPVLRAFFPSDPEQALLSGASTMTQQGIYGSHLWERLCHLELLDIGMRLSEPCVDCGTKHREIFMVPRSVGGFERVKKLVVRWSSVVSSMMDAN